MTHTFHYRNPDGEVHGPFTASQLLALARDGKVAPDYAVKRDDKAKWYRASGIRGLFDSPTDLHDSHEDHSVPAGPRDEPPASSAPAPAPVPAIAPDTYPHDDTQVSLQLSLHTVLLSLASVALAALALSTFLPWVRVFTGSISGLQGDGRVVLAVSIACLLILGLAGIRRSLCSPLAALVMAWGTVAAVWLATIHIQLTSVLSKTMREDGAFAAAIATQMTPGAGLLVGLAAGALLTIAAGALSVHSARLARGSSGKRFHDFRWVIAGQAAALIASTVIVTLLVMQGRSAGVSEPATTTMISSSPVRQDQLAEGARPTSTPPARELPEASPKESSESGAEESEAPQADRPALDDTSDSLVTLVPRLVGKRFDQSDYNESIWLDISWDTSQLERSLRAAKGSLELRDLFGETKLRIGWTITDPVAPNVDYEERGVGFSYNQFNSAHKWVRATETHNMQLAFEPSAVIFADGTSIGMQERPKYTNFLVPVSFAKRLDVADYDQYIWFDITWDTSGLPRPTRAIKGTLVVADMFGAPQMRIGWTIDDSIVAGEQYEERGVGFSFNQFLDSHRWLYAVDAADVQAYLIVKSIIFADGTTETYE